MRSRCCPIALSLLLPASGVSSGLSSWDQTQLELLQQYATPLRWDSLEGPPYWISGAKPQHRLRGGAHFIRLAPGEETLLRGNANTWLRLVGENRTLRSGDLEISISTDGRLFAQTPAVSTADPYSLLVRLPADTPCLIRLARADQASSPVVFAACLSREEPFPALAPYRKTIRLPGKHIRLKRDTDTASQPAWPLNPGPPLEFSVTGPASVQLAVLLRWPLTERRAEEPLTLQLRMDAGEPRLFILSPELDARHRTMANGETELVSRRMSGYFTVPEGKHLFALEASAPVYVSAFLQLQPDFLLPLLNGPAANSLQVLRNSASPRASLPPGPTALPWTPSEYAESEQSAWALASDNSFRESSAQAADWLNRVAQARPDYPPAQRSAEALWRERTLYREVLPSQIQTAENVQQYAFPVIRLAPLFGAEMPMAVVNATLDQAAAMFASGHFSPVPHVLSSPLVYHLPSRSERSKLRIAVLGVSQSWAALFVQLDQGPQRRLVLEPKSVVPGSQVEPSPGIGTLRVLEQQSSLYHGPKRWPIGDFDLPLPLLAAGIVELPLDARVRQVRIYQETSLPLSVCVAYRAAKPFALGEAQYVEMIKQAGTNILADLFRPPSTPPLEISEPLRQLRNHCLPLIRLLRAHAADFAKSIDVGTGPHAKTSRLSPEECSQLKASGQTYAQQDRLIEAIEVWNQLFWNGTTSDRQQAALAIMSALQSLGEEFLAVQYARCVLLNSSGRELPTSAIALLEENARESQDPEMLEELRAFLFIRCPCPLHLASLVEALVLNSRDQMALWAGLMLPPDSRPSATLLEAALHAGWWQTFNQLLNQLAEPEDRAFWQAQKHLVFYRFSEAERELDRAGEKGRPILEALREGLQIREGLADVQMNRRFKAVLAWEQWQATQPGERRWEEAHDVAQESPGAGLIFNCEQNEFASCFGATPGKALRLRFLGPMCLRVDARPLLPAGCEVPVDDWLEIRENGLTNRVPVCRCIPNPALELLATTDVRVGTKTAAILKWGPGFHEVEICLASRRGLFRVRQQEPALPLRVLPRLNPERLASVLQGRPSASLDSAGLGSVKNDRGTFWLPAPLARFDSGRLSSTVSPGGEAIAKELAESQLGSSERLRLALRFAPETAITTACTSNDFRALPLAEQRLACSRWNSGAGFAAPDPVNAAEQADYWLATGQIEKLLHSTLAGENPLQRLTWLLQIAELAPAWREEAQALGERLMFGNTNLLAGADRLLERLDQDRAWMPLPITLRSAGIRPIQLPFDLPQDPLIRTRRALLRPAGTNQFTIGADGMLKASLALNAAARLKLRVELAKAGFSPIAPLSAAIQLDDAPVQSLALSAAEPFREVDLSLGQGPHLIKVWMTDPVVNQFVRVALSAATDSQVQNTRCLPDVELENRFFYAATASEPIRFSWNGPALLRVDEWRENSFRSRYQWVDKGKQDVTIGPAAGAAESWCRIFVRTTQTNTVQVRPTWATRDPEEVPPPMLHLPEAPSVSEAQLTDYYRLGRQEDGTFTAGILLAHRRPFELSPQQTDVANEFVEADANFRKVTPPETLWFNTQALGRVHRPGDLTFGLLGEVDGRPPQLPFDWACSGAAYVGTTGPQQQDVQGALYTTSEIGQLRHLTRKLDLHPYAAAFAHYLTLDSDRARQYSYVDQDLYTPYRADHRWGWVLGTQVAYRPWLDTLLTADADLRSNEDLSPDHWGMLLAWQQLLGPLRAEIAYGFRQALDNSYSTEFLQGISAGLFGEYWLNGRQRLEFGAQYRHDWPAAGDSYFLVLRWDFSHGRGYRDSGPRSVVFRDLRTRRIPAPFNNQLRFGPPGAILP